MKNAQAAVGGLGLALDSKPSSTKDEFDSAKKFIRRKVEDKK